jgi:hypothetical protein
MLPLLRFYGSQFPVESCLPHYLELTSPDERREMLLKIFTAGLVKMCVCTTFKTSSLAWNMSLLSWRCILWQPSGACKICGLLWKVSHSSPAVSVFVQMYWWWFQQPYWWIRSLWLCKQQYDEESSSWLDFVSCNCLALTSTQLTIDISGKVPTLI